MRSYAVAPFILQSLLRLPAWLVLKVFCRFEVRGRERLCSLPRPFIVAPNHLHRFLDVMVVNLALPWPKYHPLMYADGGKEFYEDDWVLRILYPIFKLLGGVSLKRNTGNYEEGLTEHFDVLADGYIDCLFPEGKCSKKGTLRRGRGGVVFLGANADVLVVPTLIIGTWQLGLWDLLLSRRQIIVVFGDPIKFAPQGCDSRVKRGGYYQNAADFLMARIADMQDEAGHVEVLMHAAE